MGKIIGLTFDVKEDWIVRDGDPVDASAEFDDIRTVEALEEAFGAAGHTVTRIGNVRRLLESGGILDVDLVFNICEGVSGRNRESQVPVLLEYYGIPFAGSDALTLGVTLDKIMAKRCFLGEGLPTPRFFKAQDENDLAGLARVSYPLIVKTSREGTSKGITKDSVVHNEDQLRTQIARIVRSYQQPALVEEFIRGTEFTVPVIGNRNPQAMPVVQYAFNGNTELGDIFYTYTHVKEKLISNICPAKISEELRQKLQSIAVAAYQSVDCLDFGRVDFRVDEMGQPYILEINPLPNLSPDEVWGLYPKATGSTYAQEVNKILDSALERYGLLTQEAVRQ